MKVLIVDDSRFALNRLNESIRTTKPDCEVIMATSGAEALKMVSESSSPIQLAILDYNMPGMNGIDLIQQLKNHISLENIVILSANASFMTGETPVPEQVRYIKKPISPEKLAELLGTPAGQKSTYSTPHNTKDFSKLSELFLQDATIATEELSTVLAVENSDFRLSVPVIEPLNGLALTQRYLEPMGSLYNLIRINLRSPKDAVVFMLLSKEVSKSLVAIVAKEELEPEDYLAAEADVLTEIGNVVMNRCLIQLCQALQIKIVPDVPLLVRISDKAEGLKSLNIQDSDALIYFCVAFNSQKYAVNGQIGIVLNQKLLDLSRLAQAG